VRLPAWLTPRDVVVPLICVGAVLALVAYLSQPMSSIVRSTLTFDRILQRTVEHTVLSLTITALVLLVAVPLGILVTRRRTRWMAPGVVGIANAGQAVPNIGLIALIGIAWFVGFWAVVLALTTYAVLPVLRNTIVGIQQVDPDVLDAARGMGMSSVGILGRVELPLAVPVIAAGARTALVLAVGTVAIGDFIGAGGLGDQIFTGIKLNRSVALVTGATLVAVLALLLDWLGSVVERLLTPAGIR
jgi:osmoprotectant transport system permease protein